MDQVSQLSFEVSNWVHRLGSFIERRTALWVRLGNLETRFLRNQLDEVRIDRPVYISGLARSGTTILLEIIARHPDVVTHQYRDYPPIYTPFWWNWMLRWMETQQTEPVERSHRDGIMVTPASPEAMEEVLWMTFFPESHRPEVSNVLNGDISNPTFEAFYRDHLGKLLLVRKGHRYVSKNNYNTIRLEYIQKILPDALFIIPIREPVAHIASLIKQHRLFCEQSRNNPKALGYLRRVGHFEFGFDRRPINTGNSAGLHEVLELWEYGEEVRGWARYWAYVYDFLFDRLASNHQLHAASLVMRYEDLCAQSEESLRQFFQHAQLESTEVLMREFSQKLRRPTYYQPTFSDEELHVIGKETCRTAAQFGYPI